MEVICEMMKLKADRVKDYVELHASTWPDLVKVTRQSGMLELYVYLLDNLVVVVMKCESFETTNSKLASNEVFQRWDQQIKAMLLIDEPFFHTSEVLLDLTPIWRLDNFDDIGVLKA